ncbi:uncharacterized protein isoform X38 [Salmo salar]|uniref:Uncharacterized protein isoform X38 n=1 Tax=Salmo salar TaxID=8030 RepID=A0ABM3ENN0_SALSA|nr:uncharacterized protein LOC106602685 isoform X38 [Salmo salar]
MFTTVGNRGTMHLGLCLRVLILVALPVPIRAAQPAPETFTLTVPDGPTTTLSGSSVSLLCQVSPLFNVEPLEVRWYRSSNFHSPVLLYKDHKIQEAPVDPRYRGRVSLTGGLERGNVSLTLERVTLEDMGEYVCQVTSEQWYEKASVFLTVNVTGSEPVLSVAEARGGGGQVNVTCLSEGWSPQPKLTWRNKDGTEIRNEQEVLNTSDPQGLVSVSSWLLYTPSYSDWLACTVSLSEEAKRAGRILPHINTAPTAVPGVSKEAYIVTLVLLVLFLVICALCSVILWKRRGSMWSSSRKSRNRSDQTELGQRPAETKKLIEGAENTVPTPTEQRAAGKEVHLEETKNLIEGAENTVPTPPKQRAAGNEVNLEAETNNSIEAENTVKTPTEHISSGEENSVPTPTEQRAAGKEVHLEGAENTVPTPTDQRAAGKEVHLKKTKNLIEGAENTVLRPTEQRAAGKEVNLEVAESTVATPTDQRAAGKELNLGAESNNSIEGAENTVKTPTEHIASGKEVHLKGEENSVPTPTEQRAAGKEVHLEGAENTVPRHTDQRAAGKEVNLKGAENTVPKSTEQRADGKKVKLKGAENTVSRPTEQRAAGKQVKLNGAENTVPRPTERRASGKQVNLKVLPKCAPLGAENTVPRPTEKRAAGKQVNLKGAPLGAENTLPTPTEQRAAGKQVHLEAENNNSIERAENTVKTPTEHISSGKEVNLKDWHQVKGFKGEENSVPTPTEQRAAGKQVNLEVAENTVPTPTDQRAAEEEVNLKGAENTVPTPTEQRAAGKQVNLEGAENTVKIPTEHISSGKEVNLKDWHQVKGFKENIILDEKTAHPVIRVNRGNQAHYVKEKDTENASIRMHLHVFSKESFSSGQHYWEVKVKERTTGKLSWYVGVASENVERNCNVPLTPQNGFWILSFDKEKCFHVNTDPQSPITVEELTIVGVFLDCDRHTLSFYNVDTESPLYTFTDVKTSNYFPVLSPGQHDKTPIRIN